MIRRASVLRRDPSPVLTDTAFSFLFFAADFAADFDDRFAEAGLGSARTGARFAAGFDEARFDICFAEVGFEMGFVEVGSMIGIAGSYAGRG